MPTPTEIFAPMGGLDRSKGRQSQPPFSSPDILNCRPRTTNEDRARFGSRPGLTRLVETISSANPVRMLGQLRRTTQTAFKVWEDTFDGFSLGGEWETIVTHQSVNPLTTAPDTPGSGLRAEEGCVGGYSALSGVDTFGSWLRIADFPVVYSSDYQLEVFIAPHRGQYWGDYCIHFACASTPNLTPANGSANGVSVKFSATGASGTGTLGIRRLEAGVGSYANTSVPFSAADGFWLRVLVSGFNVTATAIGVSTTVSVTGSGAFSGNRIALSVTPTGGLCQFDTFRLLYRQTNIARLDENILMSSINGSLYYNNALDVMTLVGTAPTLKTDRNIQCVDYQQNLFIADSDDLTTSGSGGQWHTPGSRQFTLTSPITTSAYPGSPTRYRLQILSVGGSTTNQLVGTYLVGSIISATVIELIARVESDAPPIGSSDLPVNASDIEYIFARAPVVYSSFLGTADELDQSAALTTPTLARGFIPLGCPLIAAWHDRLFFGGNPKNVWYASRVGDPTDFNYGADSDDLGRAIGGTVSTQSSLADDLTALIPSRSDWFIFGMLNSTAVMRGDLASGGIIESLSGSVGPVGAQAWAALPDGSIVTLTREGLYLIDAAAQSMQPLSRQKLPRELQQIDASNYDVLMAYDARWRGVHVYLVGRLQSAKNFHWWVDVETGTFWPVKLFSSHEPTALCNWAGYTADQACVVLGDRIGQLLYYQRFCGTDNTVEFSNYALLGPLQFGGSYNDGMITELDIALAAESGSVGWSLLPGDTAAQAQAATAVWTGTATRDLNYKWHPRMSGASIFLKLSGSTVPWALEQIFMQADGQGKRRKL